METLVFRDRASFHVADYVIFGLTVAISSGVGIYFAVAGGRQKTTSEYLVGNRKLHVVPVGLSLIVSFESSIFMLGFPAEVYGHGTQFWMVHVGLILTFLCVAQVIVPLMHPLGITSVYQYLELRYRSRTVRLLASILGILYQTFYMGIVLYGPATALEAVTRFPVTYSIFLVAAASVFYTSLGGIKAVVWTDALQFLVMLGGLMALIIVGCIYVGGFDKMWQLNVDGGRVKFFDFNPSPLIRTSFWTLVIGNTIRSIEMGFNQSTIQRVVSVKSQKSAKIIVLCLYPGFLLFGTLACLEGMISYAYFAYTECDPYGAGLISNTNQVLPYVVTDLFQTLPGLSGLFLASLFSACLSTLSSSLSSISAMVWTDFLQPFMKNASELRATIAAKIVVIVFGVLSIGIAFLIKSIGGPLQQVSYSILGSISGPLTGLFLAGCIFPFTNSVGAISGTVFSFGVSMWLSLGSSFSPYTKKTPYLPPAPINNCYVNATLNQTVFTTPVPSLNDTSDTSGLTAIYSISYHYFGPIGMITCVLVAIVTSTITGGCRTSLQVDPRYITPVWDQLCCCTPEAWRGRLRLKGHARSRSSRRDSGNQPEEESISLKDTVS